MAILVLTRMMVVMSRDVVKLRRFWLHPRDRYHAVTQTYNNCAETHLGGGVMSPFVSQLSAIARAHDPVVQLSGKAHEDSVHIVVIAVVHWCLRVEIHPCGNVVSAEITFCLRFGRHGSISWTAWSSRDMCVNWNEPQVSHIHLYEQLCALNDAWVWVGGCKWSLPRYPKGQSRTCYQECGCHL